jgi:hypothetical protein
VLQLLQYISYIAAANLKKSASSVVVLPPIRLLNSSTPCHRIPLQLKPNGHCPWHRGKPPLLVLLLVSTISPLNELLYALCKLIAAVMAQSCFEPIQKTTKFSMKETLQLPPTSSNFLYRMLLVF